MPIYEYRTLEAKILVCKKCNQPVEKEDLILYRCKDCGTLTKDVEWKIQGETA